jgi:hypothetical protein
LGQFIVNNNTNLTLQSSATTTRTLTISGGPGNDFVIEAGSLLNLTNATQAVAFAFSGVGNMGLIAGNYTAGGSTSNNLTTTGGTGTLVTIDSTGIVTSNLNSSSAGLVGNAASLLFTNGSNWIHQNSTTVNYIPTATWQPTATATLNGNTTGTGLTSGSPVLGNLIVNTTASTATLSAFTSNVRTIQGDLIVNNTGTGRFRATTSGLLTINGNLIINAGIFDVGSSSNAGVIVKGNTSVAAGATLDLNRNILQNEGNMVNNGSVLSSETTTTNSTINFIGTTVPQTLSGSGTFTGRVSSFGVSNPSGLTISTPVLTQRVNLFTGDITGSNNITIGTGLALGATIQIGTADNTNPGGSFDAAPIFNLGTGTFTLLYLNETTPRNTGFEVPPSRVVNNVTVNNTNGITLSGGDLTAVSSLALTNGIVTTGANTLILGDALTVGTLTGGSESAYVNGALTRSIANANTNSTFVTFPIGKAGVYTPIALAPATTSIALFKAESFGSNTGTEDPSIIGLSATRRFEAIPVSGTFTDINVRLSDAGIVSTNIPVQAPTATGAYTSAFGSTAAFVAGPPITLTSNNPVTSANYTGFLSYADSNACSGTPAPGNTIASTNAICLGTSVTLSLQNVTSGTGVTYQWKSSTDGVTYTAIAGETNATLTLTPTASLYYMCDVTCSAGPSTGTSTAVQITFANSVTATTPGTRCGQGTVDLSATANSGATINWYDSASGGALLGSGASFTTPTISTTTTYFASAATSNSGSVTIGSGTTTTAATSQPSAFVNRWPSYRIQTLYTAQELLAAGLGAGDISSMSYFTTTLGDAATNSNFTVKIGTSSQTTMTTTWVPTTSFTTVYGPVTHTHTSSGEQPINFTIPFNWDGVSNIVIEVMYNGADITNNAVTFFTTTPSNMVVHSNTSGSSISTGTVTTTRLNLKLQGQVACNSERVPVVATVTPPPALTLSATSATICESESTPVITVTSTVGDYDTYVWSPASGVTGNETTGWTFNPSVSTNYTLTATQTGGSLCNITATFDVTVNPRPSVMTISPSPAAVCVDAIQALTVSGGTIGSSGSTKIGTATTFTTATSQPTAFCNRFDHYWVQMVYTAAELTAAGVQPGNITALRFTTGAQGSANNVTDFKVRLGNTSNTSLTGFTTSGLVQVFSVATYATVVGVNTITFDTPYVWDGTSNIIVDMRQTGIDATNNATTEFTPTSNNTVVSAVTSTANAGGSDGFAASAPFATTSVNRLNTTFVWDSSEPTTITWSPITDLYTDSSATTPYVANANAATVYFKSSATAAAVTYTATSTTSFGCSRTATTDVTVNALPSVVTVNPSAVCSPATVDLTTAAVTSGSDTGLTFSYWTDSAATTSLTTANAVTTSGTYYIKGTNANGCSVVTPVTVTVNPLPVLTVTDPATVCSPATVDITATAVTSGSDTGLTLSYWTDSAATTALTTANAIITSGTYYIKAENTNGCEKIMPVTVTINVTSAPSGDATQTFCGTANITQLVVTGTGVKWYDAATGGNLLPSITAIGLTNGTTYYASQTINSCESTERFAVTVVVNSIPSAPNATAQDFCSAPTVSQLLPIGSTINWYEVETGGTPLASSAVLTANTYYVSQTVNGCESPRTAVNITITALSTPTGNTTQTVFGGVAADATIEDISVNGVNVVWYPTAADAAAGTNAIAAETQLTDGATYYAVSVIGSCRSAALAVTVTVVLDNPNFDIKALRYYPNPVVDVLTISYTNAITAVQVYDISGRLVRDMQPNSKDVTVDLSNLAASVYVVKVFADTTSSEFKVVKK